MNMKSGTNARQRANQPCTLHLRSLEFVGLETFFCRYGGSTMPGVKQASKRKRVTKAVPALGAAGLTFSLVGGASAAVAPANNESQTTKYSPNHQLTLGEEEMADVSLATFYVFDKEAAEAARNGIQFTRGRGCGRGR